MELRPWPAVVDIFNHENNEKITEENARSIGARALNKILKALARDPKSRELLNTHLRPSEFKDIVEPFDEVKE
jgi:hypothetical protein